MPETPNHGYNVPSEGQEDWHIPLNDNFERFDTDIEIRGEESGLAKGLDPVEGAKLLATDTGRTYIGDGEEWQLIESTGPRPSLKSAQIDRGSFRDKIVTNGLIVASDQLNVTLSSFPEEYTNAAVAIRGLNNWDLDSSNGDVWIGDSDYKLAMSVSLGGAGAGTSRLRAKGGVEQLRLGAGNSDTVKVEPSTVTVNGDFDVTGNKNFTQSVDTDDGEREVVYTATEAGTPHTEASGVAELADGRAEIALPEHFAWVTDDEAPLHVQTTPYSADSGGLAVVERSTDHIVVEDFGDGTGDYEFSYTVKGTREGQADKEVVREPSAGADGNGAPAPADD
jgi:hypothetical protein